MEPSAVWRVGSPTDFNNLLGVIIGYSDFVSEQIGAGSPLTNAVEQIKKAGDRASTLTRQLLAFSRPASAGNKSVEPEHDRRRYGQNACRRCWVKILSCKPRSPPRSDR